MTISTEVSKPAVYTFRARDYDVFAGLDVDRRSVAASFADPEGLLRSVRLPYSARQLLRYVRQHYEGQRVAFVYEAGPTGFGLYDELVAAGHCCLVVAPSMVPQAPGNHVKTNRLDSRKLAKALRGEELHSIHVPPGKYRELRHLVQLRDTQVKQVAATKNRIKALLLYEGIAFPSAGGREKPWSQQVLIELLALPCSESVRFKLDQLIGSLHFHFNSAAAAQKQIRHFCQKDEELRQAVVLMKSLPGIGEIVATHLVARLGDPALITHVTQIGGFLGLVSSEHSTGDKRNQGEITRAGDSRLRNKLIQSAWVSIRKDPELREFYRRIYARHPQKVAARKAIVAVARKLTMRIYAVLKEGRPYVIRELSTAPLTTEETAGPRERLDGQQNERR
jgi:transposase